MNLLIVSPHFRYFIRDQTLAISPYFSRVNVFVPYSYLSEFMSHLPFLNKRVVFSRLESQQDIGELRILPAKFFALPTSAMERRNIYLASRSCRKLLTQAHIGVDLIHAHFLDHGYIGAVIKEDSCAPMVLTVHGHDAYATPFKSEWKSIAKYVFNEADRIITVCKFNAERLQAFGVAVEKIRIIPNGFDEKMFSQIPSEKARNKIGLPVTRKILLAVGSLVAAKGHYSLIDAMSIILKKRKDVMLVIVGDGPLANKLRRRAYVLGIEHNVLLVGRKNHQEIPTWMNASDLFVLPSIEEGFPTVIPEAMACGKPVIASKVGGIPEILSDPSLGVLVNPMDRTEIAESILDALEKKWDSQEIIEHAKKYTWHSLSRQIWNVYSEIL